MYSYKSSCEVLRKKWLRSFIFIWSPCLVRKGKKCCLVRIMLFQKICNGSRSKYIPGFIFFLFAGIKSPLLFMALFIFGLWLSWFISLIISICTIAHCTHMKILKNYSLFCYWCINRVEPRTLGPPSGETSSRGSSWPSSSHTPATWNSQSGPALGSTNR